MFESVTIRGGQSDRDTKIDIGSLAESLLFYQHVHLILDRNSLADLVQKIGIDNLRYLIDSGICSATFFRDDAATYSQPIPGSSHIEHGFIAVQLSSRKDGTKLTRNRDHVVDSILKLNDDSIPKGKVNRLSEIISVKSTGDLNISGVGLLQSARTDLNDTQYLRDVVSSIFSALIPEYQLLPSDLIRIVPYGERFIIDTNLNFEKLNELYHLRVSPTHSSLSPASLINYVLATRRDISLALKYGTDFIASDLSSKLLQVRIRGIIEKRAASQSNLSRFDDMIIKSSKTIRESVNSGALTFSEFLKVLEQAQKFKNWLKGVPPDADLVDSYYQEISRKTIIDRLPSKLTRFSMFTLGGLGLDALGLGGLGTAGGVALNAADTFLLERLVGGWKPNQFVEGSLLKALSKKDD